MQMILKSMGVKVDKDDMDNYCAEVDEEATGKFSFAMFCAVSAKFMIEDDEEQMKEELKEAFRIYDKEGQGFITTDVLKEEEVHRNRRIPSQADQGRRHEVVPNQIR